MKLLIDADYIVYKCCAACETEIDYGEDVILVTSNFSEAYSAVKREISNIQMQFGSFAKPTLFFSDSKNFRKKIFPEYKGHRNRKKPCGYKRVISGLKIEYDVIVMPQLEADDAMGIYATKLTGNIIVSPDKDMKQIPGKLYNLEDTITITPEEGAKVASDSDACRRPDRWLQWRSRDRSEESNYSFRERRLQLGYSCQSF